MNRFFKLLRELFYKPNPKEMVCVWIFLPKRTQQAALYAEDEETLKLFALKFGYVGNITQKTMSFWTYNYLKTLTFKATVNNGVYKLK
jgi:hypothetical protein